MVTCFSKLSVCLSRIFPLFRPHTLTVSLPKCPCSFSFSLLASVSGRVPLYYCLLLHSPPLSVHQFSLRLSSIGKVTVQPVSAGLWMLRRLSDSPSYSTHFCSLILVPIHLFFRLFSLFWFTSCNPYYWTISILEAIL